MVENGTTACAWDTVIPFAPLWEAYRRVIKPNGAIVLFGSEPFSSHLRLSNEKWFKYDWIWRKRRVTGHLNAQKMPMKAHEIISVFYASKPTYNAQKTPSEKRKIGTYSRYNSQTTCYGTFQSKSKITDFYYPVSVIEFSHDPELTTTLKHNPGRGERHPTQKPVALLEYLIRTYANEGDTVLDSCFGSGTTAIACMRTGRKFIGIEKDETYFRICQERVRDEQRQGRLFTV